MKQRDGKKELLKKIEKQLRLSEKEKQGQQKTASKKAIWKRIKHFASERIHRPDWIGSMSLMERRKQQKNFPEKVVRKWYRPVWKQVKLRMIGLLVVMNLLLLAVSGTMKAVELFHGHQARVQMDSVLSQKGILCGSSIYRAMRECPQPYSLRADGSVQKALARTLLTGTITSEARGNATAWLGDNGTVEWSQSGEIQADAELNTVVQPRNKEEAAKMVQKLLKQSGISVEDDQITAEEDVYSYIITVKQEIHNSELLGCSMIVNVMEGNTVSIQGTWCTGEAQEMTLRSLENYSAEQAIFAFVSAQNNVGRIVSAQPAYVLSDKSGGRFTTEPCWRFTTENGGYVLNILTGDVVATTDLGLDTAPPEHTDTGSGTGGE